MEATVEQAGDRVGLEALQHRHRAGNGCIDRELRLACLLRAGDRADADLRRARLVLEAIRASDPAVIASTHLYSGDLASFQLQFMEKPTNRLVYLQHGAMHQSFSDIAQAKGVGVVTSTVIGLLRDEIGKRFAARYVARFGEGSTPHIGCQSYSALHHFALAASVANGTAGPGGAAQNRKVAEALKSIVYRSVSGVIRYDPVSQAAVPYPVIAQDPSLMPHLFFQVRSETARADRTRALQH